MTTAVIDGNSLISYLRDPVTQEIDMIANRTILPSKFFLINEINYLPIYLEIHIF